MKYDYLIVGAGLYGAVLAHECIQHKKTVLILEKRPNIAGNIYTEEIDGINVHKYGAHIFHTNNKEIWDYISQFTVFNRYTNCPIANYNNEIYSLPFNMYTFNKMWGVSKPEDARKIIDEQRKEIVNEPKNLEEQAISLVGRDIYERLIKGYTEKQWGRDCKLLPPFIIKRIPVRFTYDNNYFNAIYQGIPIGGYTKIVDKLLSGCDIKLNTNYLSNRKLYSSLATKIIYTGTIDSYFDYCYGPLEYRSIHFDEEKLNIENYQGNAVVNYTDKETAWTRIIEHKWFEFGKDKYGFNLKNTIISKEYSDEWKFGDEPYYPVNDERNNLLYKRYQNLAQRENNVVFGGRLGEYKYYDMDQIIINALDLAKKLLG